MNMGSQKFKGNVEKCGSCQPLGPVSPKRGPSDPFAAVTHHFSTRPFNIRALFIFVVVLSLIMAPANLQAKTQWKRGMWIGAVSGAVVVGGTFTGLAAGTKCDARESDLQFCGADWTAIMGVGGAVVGGLLGMGIGALIGSAIKKEEPVVLAPVISIQEDKTYGGLSLTKNF